MTQKKYTLIKTVEDIINLRIGEIINMTGHGPMVHTGIEQSRKYMFLSRGELEGQIIELHVRKKGLFPEKGGLLGYNDQSTEEHLFYDDLGKTYDSRDDLLKRASL